MSPVSPARLSRMTPRTLLLVALLVPLHLPLAAQVNIESLRREDPPDGDSGSLGGDLSINTGNVDFVQMRLNGRVNRVEGNRTSLLIAEGGVAFLRGSRFASSGLLHYRQTQWVSDVFGPEWYAQLNYDRPQLLDLRAVVGAGVRTEFASSSWGRLGAGTALMLQHERLDLTKAAVHDWRTSKVRNSTFLTFRIVPGDYLVISSTTYIQPSLSDFTGDVRVLENMRIAASVTENWDLTVTFDLRYDSGPPDGIEGLDTRLRTGLTYTY